MRNLVFGILAKRGLRSDFLWTHPLVYKSFLKYIPLFFDTYALMRSQFWPREVLEEYQAQRLVGLFSKAEMIPFWREKIAATNTAKSNPRETLRRMPIISKKDLVNQDPAAIMYSPLISRSDVDHTSGSTGMPFHFRQDWHASLRSFAITERIFRTATSERYPVVYMRARERNGFTPYKHMWFFARSFNAIENRMPDIQALGEKFKNGFVLYGYTSWILEVARQMQRLNIQLPLKAVMVAGEHLSKQEEAFIERVTGVDLFTFYASRETGFLAFECPLHKLHLAEEWAYFEVVDEEGGLVANGKEGRLLVTTFDNRIMPFIRYDLGDRAIIHEGVCECGRTLRTITFRGRTAEIIELDDGRSVSLLDVAANIDWYWQVIRQFQIVQKNKSAFLLRVIPGPNYENERKDVEAMLKRLLHRDIAIAWEEVDSIPAAKSGKAVYFVRDFE